MLFSIIAVVTLLSSSSTDNNIHRQVCPDGGYVLVDGNNELVAVSHASAIASDSVGPLLDPIAFGQGYPYNMYCPYDTTGRKCVTGCVATAMAQIMAYHQWPNHCLSGSVSFSTPAVPSVLSMSFDTVSLDWMNILPTYAGVEATEEQKKAIAILMKSCGFAAKMEYSSSGSGTYSTAVPSSLMSIFNYRNSVEGSAGLLSIEKMSEFTNVTYFQNALIAEIDAKRPVYASGTNSSEYVALGWDGAHAFVIDGYCYAKDDVKKRYPFFHFNWGWNGSTGGIGTLWFRLQADNICPYYAGMDIIRGITPNRTTPLEEIKEDFVEEQDNRIFDLLGHEIAMPVQGQIYILHGKKFIAQ